MKFEDLDVWKRGARLSANIYKKLAQTKDSGSTCCNRKKMDPGNQRIISHAGWFNQIKAKCLSKNRNRFFCPLTTAPCE